MANPDSPHLDPPHLDPPHLDPPHLGTAESLAQVHRDISGLFEQVSSPEADRPAVLQTLIRRLSAHCSVEKQHLAPAVDGVGGQENAGDELSAANKELEQTLGKVERRSASSPDMADLVTHLLDTFDQHLDHYRREIQPLLEGGGALAGDAQLAERVAVGLDTDDAHPHPLMPDRGPLGRAGRAVASLFDGARNRTVDR